MANKYHDFFKDSPEGKYFMQHLEAKIAEIHRDSEANPDSARDNAQKACGIREVVLMINVMSTDSKKGRTPSADERVALEMARAIHDIVT